jgi:DNA-directed RNA polymerase subunit beta
LRVPSSYKGTVIDVQVFTRDGLRKIRVPSRSKRRSWRLSQGSEREYRIYEEATFARLAGLLEGQDHGQVAVLSKGTKLTKTGAGDLDREQWFKLKLSDADLNSQLALLSVAGRAEQAARRAF